VFDYLRPGFDLPVERERRRLTGNDDAIGADDLYPDAIPCLEALRSAGYRTAIVGNTPASLEKTVRELGLRADVIDSSES
jgi:FMN phosphatase YigB (HAD superfamily)